jgi:hypothetical protein
VTVPRAGRDKLTIPAHRPTQPIYVRQLLATLDALETANGDTLTTRSRRGRSPTKGGGYLIEFRDLPGCPSDGETIEDAIRSGPRRGAVVDRAGARIW